MPRIHFPSQQFPPLPQVALDVPDGWEPAVAPGAVVAIRDAAAGTFAANVLVTVTRHPSEYTLAEAAANLDRELAELPEAETMPAAEIPGEGGEAHSCTVAFRHPEAGTLVQVHLLARVPNGGAADFVHFVGTAAGDHLDEGYATVVKILESVGVAVDSMASA